MHYRHWFDNFLNCWCIEYQYAVPVAQPIKATWTDLGGLIPETQIGFEWRRGMVHVLDNGLPCMCPNCTLERNQNAELNEALVNKFRQRMKPDGRPPRCGCNYYGDNDTWHESLEGCFRPGDFNYERSEPRAHDLLLSMLTENQRETWTNEKYFSVLGSNGITYRIYRMPTYNVLNTESMHWLCTLPMGGDVPPSDGRIAQMLRLQTDAAGFESTANHSTHCLHPNEWKPPDLGWDTVTTKPKRYGATALTRMGF